MRSAVAILFQERADMNLHRDDTGQTIILVALAIPCLIAFIGLAVDAGALFKDRRQIQTAADAAAIAGALNLTNGTYVAAGKAASSINGFTDGSAHTTVNVVNGPTWPSSEYFGQSSYVEATVTKVESTIFMAAFGYPSVTVTARAVAANQAPGNGCVTTLGTTGTDLTVQGSLSIDARTCAFNVDSSSSTAVKEIGNGGSVLTSSVGVVGPISSSGYGDFTPKPTGGVVPYSDPLAGMQYPYTCTQSGGCTCTATICSSPTTQPVQLLTSPYETCKDPGLPTNSGNSTTTTVNLSPGCYDMQGGEVIGAQTTVNMSPGVYFFTDGAITIQAGGTLDGTAITMIMTGNSTINMTGTPNLDITAPDKTDTTAAFPGILYYQVPADTATLNLQGGSTSIIEGVFYAPTAAINFQGTAGGTIYADFVSQTLSLAGNPSFMSYASLPGGGAAGMHATALVE